MIFNGTDRYRGGDELVQRDFPAVVVLIRLLPRGLMFRSGRGRAGWVGTRWVSVRIRLFWGETELYLKMCERWLHISRNVTPGNVTPPCNMDIG